MSKNKKTMDANEAAAYVSYAFTDVAAIYPITPSSTMAELVDEWSANGKKNIFNQTVKVSQMQSEAGAAGAVHGSLVAGALTTTYTASQGLLLMIPNMYKIAGELLPCVFHVSARALATHALSIFGDHQDVMASRGSGFAMLSSNSVQEAMDLGAVSHLSTIKSSIPFIHFFDGFRTSHEVQKIDVLDYEDLAKIVDYKCIKKFRDRALNPEHPSLKGTAQNPDIYFQGREASNLIYEKVPDIVNEYMNEINKITGKDYKPFNYYGDKSAENIIVAMGSVCDTIEETIDYLNKKGEKVGLIKVRLYRPFSNKYFFDIFPSSVKRIAVLDRTKEPGSIAEPLYEDIKSLFYNNENAPYIIGGRYGLGSKDTTPSQIMAVYENLKSENSKDNFTIGIVDDLSNTSLTETDFSETSPKDTIKCKFWGLGSDGTVGANKLAIKIIGDNTSLYAQGYFSYDSKKSGGTTVSHLRFGKSPIKSSYLINDADFIACHNQSYIHHYDLLKGLKTSGIFVLNCIWNEQELSEHLPSNIKKYIIENNINFYIINATKIAKDIGLGNRINMIMQSAFFKLTNVIPIEDAVKYLKESIKKAYSKKGDKIVNMNYEAVDKGIESLVRVNIPSSWSNDKNYIIDEDKTGVYFVDKIQTPMAALEGDLLPVSAFKDMIDGTFPLGTTAYEKRGIAVTIPKWINENCIQCNRCSYVCPHAVIRPFLLDEDELSKAPNNFKTKKAVGKGLENLSYKIQVSPLDCTGCGNCANVCPSPKKALVMSPAEEEINLEMDNWNFAIENISIKDDLMDKYSVKGSQFAQPLLEFSGACAGCGETAYVKVLTQLFGDRMMIANATGCSSIWGASAPSIAYCKNKEGKGPSWGNSLFEDNAEYGFGMYLAVTHLQDKIKDLICNDLNRNPDNACSKIYTEYLDNIDNPKMNKETSINLLNYMNHHKDNPISSQIIELKDFLIKKSVWIIGGDGWAYDIGYGGLDHVLASGENINVLVLDTEVYSNTGGQSSKATPTGAVAKFASSGKKIRKKDLGMMAMSYGYVYVAQVSLGSNMEHVIKTIKEAESYNGPSLIICYAPCIAHGIKTGMATTVDREKKAVDSGYWALYRYNPLLKDKGENPFTLDSKEPSTSFDEHIQGEIRYSQLANTFPSIADKLFEKAYIDSKIRNDNYKKLSK